MSRTNSEAPKKTVGLVILDGFGYSETSQSNAIAEANTPTWDRLWASYPHALVHTSGRAVGLPDGQMGNSEVGHMNLGAGRVVYQNFTRITKDIADGQFQHNPVLCAAVDAAKAAGGRVHVMGLLSPGGVHSHEDHLKAAVSLAAERGVDVCVHAFLDGRDMPPRSAEASLKGMQMHCKQLGVTGLVSMVGRYYAMDRDQRWDRIQVAYDLLTQGVAQHITANPLEALQAAYTNHIDDEFMPATAIRNQTDALTHTLADGDTVLFMNFRPDRARQLSQALIDPDCTSLVRSVRPQLAQFVMLTEFAKNLPAVCAYPPTLLNNTLGVYLAQLGKTQLRIAETEKYAHVTFFFNGGEEAPVAGEQRIMVPSPQVATYDLKPEMSAPEVTDRLCAAIRSGEFDVVICNYANGDMVGHTGNMAATQKAIEALDTALAEVTTAILEVGGELLITADHGNAELMVNPKTGAPVTSHTVFPVPLIYVSGSPRGQLKDGRLCDIAPTLLSLLEMSKPVEMTGENLLE